MIKTSVIDKKKITINSIYMYFRMIIVMIVQLYTSRVILANLGLVNYGIWNVVASFIVAFTFIKGPIGTSIQRFLNFEMGRNNGGNPHKVFNCGILIYVFLSLFFIVILEIAGGWFVLHEMNIPIGRESETYFTLQMTILSLVSNLIKVPFESLVIAHERMSFYALQSIVEVLLKLLNAFSLSIFCLDKLELFVINYFIIDLSLLIIIVLYCRNQFKSYSLSLQYDKFMIHKIINFTGWTLLGALSGICVTQGINLFLNVYFGVLVNAAMGIATQVNGAVNSFVTNFQTVFKPQIMKGYAAHEIIELNNLINQTSKYSYILLCAITCPFLLNCNYIINLWLNEVPIYTNEMCSFLLIENLVCALGGPMWMTIFATGKLKWYQISIFIIEISTLPIAYCVIEIGQPPYSVISCKCFISLFVLADRLFFLKKSIDFSIKKYVYTVLNPLILCTLLSFIGVLLFYQLFKEGLIQLIFTTVLFGSLFLISTYFIALTKVEKSYIKKAISKIINIF